MSGEHVMLAEYHAPLSDDSKMEINIKIIDSKMILLNYKTQSLQKTRQL